MKLVLGFNSNEINDSKVQSFMDPLTGAYLYDKCKDNIDKYIKSSNEIGGIMLIDIDDFNDINLLNTYEFGDKVLKKSIYDIENILPNNSIIYRLYGDKFIIVCPNLNKEDMEKVFGDIQKYTLELHQLNDTSYKFTISAGMIMFNDYNNSINELICRVNSALKIAKSSGKNKYEFYENYIKIEEPSKKIRINTDYSNENSKFELNNDLVNSIIDATPLCINLWSDKLEFIDCNKEAIKLFEVRDKGEYLNRFFDLSPKYQPCGRLSKELAFEKIEEAFKYGKSIFKWTNRKLNGELIPCEIILVRMKYDNQYIVVGYTKDLRDEILAQKAIRSDNELLNELMDATPLCLNLWRKGYINTQCNKEALSLFDLHNHNDYLERFFELSPEYQPDGELSSEKAKKMIDEAFDKGENKFEWMHCKLNGELIPSEVTLKRIKIKNEYMIAGYTRDMREQIERENKIKLINARSRAILENMPLGYIQYDIEGNITDLNPEIINIVGANLSNDKIKIEDYFPEYQPSGEKSFDKLNKKFKYAVKEKFCKFEFILKHINGNLIHTNMTMIYLNSENVIICFVQDLSEVKSIALMNDKLKELAYFDGLTGVYNRKAFFEELDKKFKYINKKEGYPLILIDFDHFKKINDTYGHITGDRVLQETIRVIKDIIPKDSLIGRYGGDEFLIQPGFILEENLIKMLENIINNINKLKIKYQDDLINISISMGSAFYNDKMDYNTWIQRADSALYKVKGDGRNSYKITK